MSVKPNILIVILLIFPGTVSATDYYVDQNDPQASDTNPGTESLPFETISAALGVSGPGDTVLIKEGTYYETISLPSGDENNPFTLRAAPGERVIVSGMERITNWAPYSGNIWVTTFDWEPTELFVGIDRETIAQEPNEGWWVVEGAEEYEDGGIEYFDITDTLNLIGSGLDVVGGEANIWTTWGDTSFYLPVTSIDTQTGVFTVIKNNPYVSFRDPSGNFLLNRYWFQNHRSLIDRPGEWAVEENGGQYNIYFWPKQLSDLQNSETTRISSRVILVQNAENVEIEGIEVIGSIAYGHGIFITNSEDVTVKRCIVYHNMHNGIRVDRSNNVNIVQNIISRNSNGIRIETSNNNVTIEENDIGNNYYDGLLVTWGSNNTLVRRNYIHDHFLWGHPDSVQLFREVDNISFIENVIFGSGQSIMTEETSGGKLVNNLIVGSSSQSIVLAHENSYDYNLTGNTIAFCRYGCIAFSAQDYELHDNVIVKGNNGRVYHVHDTSDYVADNNLFYSSYISNPGVFDYTVGGQSYYQRTLEQFQAAIGQDQNSVYADPLFVNVPRFFAVMEDDRIHESTRSTFYMADGSASGFSVGDIVEIDFDGIPRTVTTVSSDTITVDPELFVRPIRNHFVFNWEDNGDFDLDFRLRQGSPGEHLSGVGGLVGSTLDIQAYQRGDFDGDGFRDIPASPFDTPCTQSSDCSEVECNTASCIDSTCQYTPVIDGTSCTDNGLFCDGQETCQSGACTSSGSPCSVDDYACTLECNEGTDSCETIYIDSVCDDGYSCTTDTCVGSTGDENGCLHVPDDNACLTGFPECESATCDPDTGCGNYLPEGCEIPELPESLMLWLKFDDDLTDLAAADSSWNGNDASCTTCPTYLPAGGYDNGGAYHFDGVDDYLTIDSVSGDNSLQGTYTFWLNYKTIKDNDGVITSTSFNPLIECDNGRIRAFIDIDGYPYYIDMSSSETIEPGEWEFYAIVYNATDGVIYKNGQVIGQETGISVSDYGSTTNLYIGSERRIDGRYITGIIDDIRVYDRDLTEGEILALYTGQTYHRADTSKDGCIDLDEMLAFMNRWKVSVADVSMPEMMQVIGLWKQGIGC